MPQPLISGTPASCCAYAQIRARIAVWQILSRTLCSNTVLPCRLYLRHCILAARNLGQEVEDNFLDYTFLVRLLQ